MDIKRFNDFLSEGMFVDKIGRLRSDIVDPNDFPHSTRTEKLLIYIDDMYTSAKTDKPKFDYMLNDIYAIDRGTKSVYTDLAMALRDEIITEVDIESILDDLEDLKYDLT